MILYNENKKLKLFNFDLCADIDYHILEIY